MPSLFKPFIPIILATLLLALFWSGPIHQQMPARLGVIFTLILFWIFESVELKWRRQLLTKKNVGHCLLIVRSTFFYFAFGFLLSSNPHLTRGVYFFAYTIFSLAIFLLFTAGGTDERKNHLSAGMFSICCLLMLFTPLSIAAAISIGSALLILVSRRSIKELKNLNLALFSLLILFSALVLYLSLMPPPLFLVTLALLTLNGIDQCAHLKSTKVSKKLLAFSLMSIVIFILFQLGLLTQDLIWLATFYISLLLALQLSLSISKKLTICLFQKDK